MTDRLVRVGRHATIKEVHAPFSATCGPLHGILGYDARPLASSVHRHDQHGTNMNVVAAMAFYGTRTTLHAWYTQHGAMPAGWTIWDELFHSERCDV